MASRRPRSGPDSSDGGETGAPARDAAVQPAAAGSSPPPAAGEAEAPPAEPAAQPGPRPDRYARSRARDAEVRRQLEPLAPGERPRVVTLAALIAFAFAIANVVATLTVHGLSGQGNPKGVAIGTTALLLIAGVGMLARQYWAVLLFECILGLQIAILTLALTRVEKLWLGLAMTVAIGLLGWLFWKLVRPMARLQIPDGPGPAQPTR
ncbi:MAG TPA: hypothetical protein VGF63_02255 [Solirubrobacteraceae bacterium]|jgi:hypothetical protein